MLGLLWNWPLPLGSMRRAIRTSLPMGPERSKPLDNSRPFDLSHRLLHHLLSELEAPVMTEYRYEYRALLRRPPSYLDSPDERERGFVEFWSSVGDSPGSVRRTDWHLSHSEESLVSVVRWERRVIIEENWIPHPI